MRLSFLHVVILSLAMVAQTISAGALGAARPDVASGRAASEHCAHAAQKNGAAPFGDQAGHRRCDHCLTCCGAANAVLHPQITVLFSAPVVTRVAPDSPPGSPLAATITHIRRARGPPLAGA